LQKSGFLNFLAELEDIFGEDLTVYRGYFILSEYLLKFATWSLKNQESVACAADILLKDSRSSSLAAELGVS
jgi:hypothetical protein